MAQGTTTKMSRGGCHIRSGAVVWVGGGGEPVADSFGMVGGVKGVLVVLFPILPGLLFSGCGQPRPRDARRVGGKRQALCWLLAHCTTLGQLHWLNSEHQQLKTGIFSTSSWRRIAWLMARD